MINGLETKISVVNMRWYNLIFFYVFNAYYKDGNYKSDIPWLTASGIMGVATFVHIINLFDVILFTIGRKIIGSSFFVPIGICITVLVCGYFIIGKRYMRIYEKYKETGKTNKRAKVLSWTYIFSSFLIFTIIVVIIH